MNFPELIQEYKHLFYDDLSAHTLKVFKAMEQCRTSGLGLHLYYCEDCAKIVPLNNSCRNRNCPVCQGDKQRQWVEKQCRNLLEVPYFHLVFTIPAVLNNVILQNPQEGYSILYHAAWQTLKKLFGRLDFFEGKGGMLCILHTWGQTLSFHPHLHCLVPGAGLNKKSELVVIRSPKFLFPVRVMARIFRAKFAQELTACVKAGLFKLPAITRALMFSKNWVVFSKAPFASPKIVVNYIGLYSHRVAISPNRIVESCNGKITFTYKDYKSGGVRKNMTLEAGEFFRRFAMHILPYQFRKIRYFGVLSNKNRKRFLQMARQKLTGGSPPTETIEEAVEQTSITPTRVIHCPFCKPGKLHKLFSLSAQQIKTGVMVVNAQTAELIYQTRAGPVDDTFSVIAVNF